MEQDPNLESPREGDDPPPGEVAADTSLFDKERDLAYHEAMATALRREIADLAPVVNESFRELICTQDNIDEYLARPDFDPEVFVSHLRGKVDRLRYMVEDLMKSRADGLAQTALPIQHKAQAIERNRKRLREAIVKTMQDHNFQRVPGIHFAVRLRNSNPSMDMARPADVSDYERFPGYVSRATVYSWNTDRIREESKDGKPLPVITSTEVVREDDNGLVFADKQITIPVVWSQGQWPEFVVNVPEKLEPKKRKKKTSSRTGDAGSDTTS